MINKIASAPYSRWFAISLISLVFSGTSLAVPDSVERAFDNKYPDAKKVEWEVDANGFWEAGFEEDDKSYRADYTKEGDWVETERSIDFEDLPDDVQTAIKMENGDREITEIEEVDNAKKGRFFDVEFKQDGKNQDVEYDFNGKPIGKILPGLESKVPALAGGKSELANMSLGGMLMEFGVNLISILIYAVGIYYMRHHNHKMMFLLLAFNLFLFPIFLLSSVLTMGFGFTIFALLALVRLRSENFDKAEVAYLLGAVALTFINSQLTAKVEIAGTAIVLATAYLADHPRLWASGYETTDIYYKISDTTKMLDRDYLAKVISEDFKIMVNAVEINRVAKNEVRLTVVYSDPDRKYQSKRRKKKDRKDKKESDKKLVAEEQTV